MSKESRRPGGEEIKEQRKERKKAGKSLQEKQQIQVIQKWNALKKLIYGRSYFFLWASPDFTHVGWALVTDGVLCDILFPTRRRPTPS